MGWGWGEVFLWFCFSKEVKPPDGCDFLWRLHVHCAKANRPGSLQPKTHLLQLVSNHHLVWREYLLYATLDNSKWTEHIVCPTVVVERPVLAYIQLLLLRQIEFIGNHLSHIFFLCLNLAIRETLPPLSQSPFSCCTFDFKR